MGDWVEWFNAYRVSAQHLASVLLAAAIWRWGGAPERWLMGAFLATMIAPMYVFDALGIWAAEASPYAPLYIGLDVLAAALFTAIALNANRNYPLWIAGFQLVAVVAHLVKALVHDVSPFAYAVLVIGPSYCQLLLLLGGFARHTARQRRFGPYREWRLGWQAPQWWRA
ncbi:hypothetical protein ACLBKU_03180 [Erythrobacter sp. NE805]|uniref:hypothetical protein n=1 Tax=Erythrobacter sp. NE805 TaxID=3389875 RepID=UPI00396B41BE